MAGWQRCFPGCQATITENKRNAASSDTPMFARVSFLYFLTSGIMVAIVLAAFPDIRMLFWSSQPEIQAPPPVQLTAVNKMIASDLNKVSSHQTSLSLKRSEVRLKKDVNTEAVAALHLARDMVLKGKTEKAFKLYQHAILLDSDHPDILNAYGEFLEAHAKDVVSAEHMYSKAVIINATHTQAIANRKRTLPLVEEIDQKRFNNVELKRDMLYRIPESHPGLRRMKKESYFNHIHHTCAIEGNTFSLSQTRSLVETRMAIAGKSVMEHNEILGMDAAYSFINSTLTNRIGGIKLEDILDIHKRVLGYVDPVEAGKFRMTQVFVGDHRPPAAGLIEEMMNEFIEWLNSEDALNLHPIELAALAHYKLVFIHPFYDGNGRTSRLLMNLIFMQSGYPPIIIRKEEKHLYYQYLETANKGDVRPFIRFTARCAERTIDQYLLATTDTTPTDWPEILEIEDDGRFIVTENSKVLQP